MTRPAYLVLIAMASIANYLLRFLPLAAGRRLQIPSRLQSGLRYIPLGVFAALVAPTMASHPLMGSLMNHAFWVACGVSALVAWRVQSPLWSMLSGVAVMAVAYRL